MSLFIGKTGTSPNWLLIFLGKDTFRKTSWKSFRISAKKVTTTTVNPGNRQRILRVKTKTSEIFEDFAVVLLFSFMFLHCFFIFPFFVIFHFQHVSPFFFMFHHFLFFFIVLHFPTFSFLFHHFLFVFHFSSFFHFFIFCFFPFFYVYCFFFFVFFHFSVSCFFFSFVFPSFSDAKTRKKMPRRQKKMMQMNSVLGENLEDLRREYQRSAPQSAQKYVPQKNAVELCPGRKPCRPEIRPPRPGTGMSTFCSIRSCNQE